MLSVNFAMEPLYVRVLRSLPADHGAVSLGAPHGIDIDATEDDMQRVLVDLHERGMVHVSDIGAMRKAAPRLVKIWAFKVNILSKGIEELKVIDTPATAPVNNYSISVGGAVGGDIRQGDDFSVSYTMPQAAPRKRPWIVRIITSAWSYIVKLWFAIVGGIAIALLLDVAEVRTAVKGMLGALIG